MTILDTTLGALFDGVAVSTMLYGVTCAQTFVYFLNDFDDDGYLKLIVVFVWMMDTLQQALTTHSAWYYLVSRCSGNPLNCGAAYWSILVQVVPGEICAVVVECYFVLKLRRFAKSNWALLLVIPSILGFAFSMVSIVQGLETPVFTSDTRFRWAPTVFGACHAVSDVIVAVLMCYFLYRAGVSSHSWDLISSMIHWTISTGVLSRMVPRLDPLREALIP